MAFLNVEISSGIDLVCEVLGLDSLLEGADLVITGEGRVDSSTVYDKAPVGVARRAKALGLPVIAMAGTLGVGYADVYQHGIDAVVPLVDRPLILRGEHVPHLRSPSRRHRADHAPAEGRERLSQDPSRKGALTLKRRGRRLEPSGAKQLRGRPQRSRG